MAEPSIKTDSAVESRIDAAPATLEQSSERREVIRQELEALNLNDQDMLRLRAEATIPLVSEETA